MSGAIPFQLSPTMNPEVEEDDIHYEIGAVGCRCVLLMWLLIWYTTMMIH